MFPAPETGNGMDEVTEDYVRGDNIVPAPSMDSLEVDAFTSNMVHMG
jgi:hypothetical protein